MEEWSGNKEQCLENEAKNSKSKAKKKKVLKNKTSDAKARLLLVCVEFVVAFLVCCSCLLVRSFRYLIV